MLTKERREPSVEIIAINAKLTSNENRIMAMETELAANTKATQAIAENTAGLIDLYTDLAAGTRFLCRVALGVCWMLEMIKTYYIPVVILSSFLWALLHHFQFPPWFFKLIREME